MDSSKPGGELDDGDVVALVQGGDREAFGILVTRYQRMVFVLAQRMTGSADQAQDVVQSSFLNAFRQIESFRGDASFKTWVYGIALNECRMLYRKSGRTVALDAVAEPPAPKVGGHAFDRFVLGKMIERLPEKQKAALVLRVCEDLPFREIGQILDTSEASAKVNYFHAVKKLRAWVLPDPGREGGPS